MTEDNPSALEDIIASDFAFVDGAAVVDGLHEVREANSKIKLYSSRGLPASRARRQSRATWCGTTSFSTSILNTRQ